MRYTIYKVTHRDSGKFYIGKHQTENLADGYFGSGKAIKAAIKKHGKDSFWKEILFEFDTEAEMNAKEVELITEELVKDRMSYNQAVGGEGGPHFKGRKHTEEAKAKFTRKGKPVSAETRAKIADANRRRFSNSEEREKLASKRRGFTHSEETKEKIAKSLRSRKIQDRGVL